MIRDLASIRENARYDLIVVGAGAAGLSAALFAAIKGGKVLVIERTEYLGGTSALSGATVWAPGTHHASGVDQADSRESVSRFLDAAVGNHSAKAMREAFLDSAPTAIRTLEAHSEVKFRAYATHPDYEQQHEGATMRGRALEPLPFDGRSLGTALDKLRPPIPEFTIFGGMMVDRTDINHLLSLKKNRASFLHAMKILGAYGLDRLGGRKRGSRLVMGNALVGRMLKSLLDLGADIILDSNVTEILSEQNSVTGVAIENAGTRRILYSDRGVVLAAGGFSHHESRRRAMLNTPVPAFSPAAPGHTGAAQDLALQLGAKFGEGGADNAFWAPCSYRKRPDGSVAVFPHFVMDRSKPGTFCVNGLGQRFVNESTSYHNFARAMFEAHKTTPSIPAYIIADADTLRKYGLGMVRMGTIDTSPFEADGYLVSAPTIADLATKLGMKPANLQASVSAINFAAETGVDPDFGRGTTPYHRVNGDAKSPHLNPTLGFVATAPFYAVKLYPGDIGASTGLNIDPDARVLGHADVPIVGLYACGNEAQSIMGGTYPGPGITLGPAITFAYRAVEHAFGAQRE